MRPGHLRVDLGDHRAAGIKGGDEVVGGQPHAVFAACIGRADLEHEHVAADPALADQRPELRIGHGQQVEHPGVGERAVGAGAAVGGKAQAVGMLGLHDAGVARAEEASHFAERGALGNQRLDERLRLRARLAPHDPVAAAYTDRVVFLADGRVVDELRAPTAERVLEKMSVLTARALAGTAAEG